MKFISKLLISIIFTLSILIAFSKSKEFKEKFYDTVYKENFNFAYFSNLYSKYFGKINLNDAKQVFTEKLNYSNTKKYNDGVELILNNSLVPLIEEGIVVYIGKDDTYGNIIRVEDKDGKETTYGNMETIEVSLYDYLEKGSFLGSTDKLYLVFKKDGKVLNYESIDF